MINESKRGNDVGVKRLRLGDLSRDSVPHPTPAGLNVPHLSRGSTSYLAFWFHFC